MVYIYSWMNHYLKMIQSKVNYSFITLFLLAWSGVIFARSGLYDSGIFKFIIKFPLSFPNSLINVKFISAPYHPLICPKTGRLDYSCLLSEDKENGWKMHDGFMIELLQLIWNIIYDFNSIKQVEAPINKQAYDLYNFNLTNFLLRAH